MMAYVAERIKERAKTIDGKEKVVRLFFVAQKPKIAGFSLGSLDKCFRVWDICRRNRVRKNSHKFDELKAIWN